MFEEGGSTMYNKFKIISTNRPFDVISGDADLENLHTLKTFPVFAGCVKRDTDIEEDQFLDMNVYISKSTGMIQITPILPLETIYKLPHGSGEVGKLWMDHHSEFAKFIHSFSPISIFEIGGGSGRLANAYFNHKEVPWTIIDLNPNSNLPAHINVINGAFDDTFSSQDVDSVVHSHVFEHVFYPDQFMKQLGSMVDNGKNMFFSIPNLLEMMKRGYTNCINFEHSIFLTEPYVDFLLAKHGFRILKKHLFLKDHSIFYAVTRDVGVMPIQISADLYEENKTLFLEYIDNLTNKVAQINAHLLNTDLLVYQFGAHVFSQFLINMGMKTDSLISIIDNDIDKQGKRLYGTLLPVESAESLRDKSDILVLVNAAGYTDEIKEGILTINPRVRFF